MEPKKNPKADVGKKSMLFFPDWFGVDAFNFMASN